MKTSTERILTTHVGSIPRPESVRALLRARLAGQAIDDAELAARAAEAVTEDVRRQAEVGLDVISDGEMSKTSFLAYTDDRLTGFVTTTAPTDPSAALTGAGGAWSRRVDSRREWRAFREYYTEYLPREMPLASPPTVCQGPITYKGQALLAKDLDTFKAARARDIRCIYDLPIAHWRTLHRLLQEEADLNPAWTPTVARVVTVRAPSGWGSSLSERSPRKSVSGVGSGSAS